MKDKMLYLAGKKFGRLTAIRCTEKTSKRGYIWECLCDCGKTTFLPTSHFKNGLVRSCGCLLKEFYKKTRVDITGKTFHRLTTIKCTEKRDANKNILWLFKCSCGNKFIAPGSEVMRGQIRSCGCKTKSKPLQLKGQRFGLLTAMKKTGEKSSKGYFLWECICDCGKKTIAAGVDLKAGRVKSCGCVPKKLFSKRGLDITGQTFNKLTAIRSTKTSDKKKNILWLFKCACGNEIVRPASKVKEGEIKSCGCQKIEKATELIEEKRKNILWVEDTCINSILSTKVPKNNVSGYTGVYWIKKRQKWGAEITFKGITHYLGAYVDVEEAAAVRKKAEKKYFKPMIEKYKKLMPKKQIKKGNKSGKKKC